MSKLTDFFPQQSSSTSSSSDVNGLNASVYADVVLVAGGGGGTNSTPGVPEGGGAGGYFRGRYGISSGKEYPVVVGAGGAAGPISAVTPTSYGGNGGNTTFDNGKLVSYGGGGSGSFCLCYPTPGIFYCALSNRGGHGGVGGTSYLSGQSIQYSNRFGCHSNQCNSYGSINGLSLDFTGYCALCPGVYLKTACSNTGTGGCNSYSAPTPASAGGSGFAVISYKTTFAGAATTAPGAVDCSPQTPGYYTYVYTSSGSFTL